MKNQVGFLGLIFALSVLLLGSVQAAEPGSGNVSISPALDVTAGSSGTWTIEYTCTTPFANGNLIVTIPPGWTLPQGSVPNGAGYVTVSSNDPACNPTIAAINGQAIDIGVDNLGKQKKIFVVYGDDSDGANPSARAVAQLNAGPNVPFIIDSDPDDGKDPRPNPSLSFLNITAGPPHHLTISPSGTTISADDFVSFTITVVDTNDNRTPLTENRTFFLASTPSGHFYLTSNHSTPITTIG
ncbi:MAG: hypothetical protein ABIA59_05005, partial [Candidatus Latescibacterota bacterium]